MQPIAQEQNNDTLHTYTSTVHSMLNKVPEITLYFWIIKVLCTTIGETAADFLNVNLNLGLSGTSLVTGVLLVVALLFQFRSQKYIPAVYWVAVTLISVFGTLVTDNLTDAIGLKLEISTIIFSVLLGGTFFMWYISEKTLSIHSIFTRKREAFYWLTILFTFALGTASGDLMAEGLGLGYLTTGVIVASVIAVTALAWRLRLNSVLSFWIIYILTRPLGASIGDFLSQPPAHGGLGLGATMTSVIFLVGILGIVLYLTVTKRDVIGRGEKFKEEVAADEERGGLRQTVIVLLIFLLFGGVGYHVRHAAIQAEIAVPPPISSVSQNSIASTTEVVSPLGDLTFLRSIAQDTLDLLNNGNQSGATTRIGDLEYEWDNAQSRLKARDKASWRVIDGKIDTVLRELRAVNPNSSGEHTALEALLATLK